MNKNKIVMVLLLLMCIGIGNASAEIYEASITILYPDDMDDNGIEVTIYYEKENIQT